MSEAAPGTTAGLRALSAPADLPVDLISLGRPDSLVFVGPGLQMVGWGTAAALALPAGLDDASGRQHLGEQLAAIATEDHVSRLGSGPLAVGALPFRADEPTRLFVPAICAVRDAEGQSWITVVGPEPLDDVDHVRERFVAHRMADVADGPAPVVSTYDQRPPPDGFTDALERAISDLRADRLGKVVLARTIDVALDTSPSPLGVLRRLREQEPSCTAFSFPVEAGQFLGASPELLVARRADHVICQPLAGTVTLSGDGAQDAIATEALIASDKDQHEHQFVVDEIQEVLARFCDDIDVPLAPSLVRFHQLAHLGSYITATLRPGRNDSVLDLVAGLHPTPAVGGVPRDVALAMIDDLEDVPRGQWAGPVGWMDAAGDGEWVIGIRSLTLFGPQARVTAGAGIVADSEARAELSETTGKLIPVLNALAPGLGDELR